MKQDNRMIDTSQIKHQELFTHFELPLHHRETAYNVFARCTPRAVTSSGSDHLRELDALYVDYRNDNITSKSN